MQTNSRFCCRTAESREREITSSLFIQLQWRVKNVNFVLFLPISLSAAFRTSFVMTVSSHFTPRSSTKLFTKRRAPHTALSSLIGVDFQKRLIYREAKQAALDYNIKSLSVALSDWLLIIFRSTLSARGLIFNHRSKVSTRVDIFFFEDWKSGVKSHKFLLSLHVVLKKGARLEIFRIRPQLIQLERNSWVWVQ